LYSIVEANKTTWPLEVYILAAEFSEKRRRQISESLPTGSASIKWIPITLSAFRSFATADHISPMTFARLLISDVLPDSISKILYLDTDLLVLDDLSSLWDTDLEGYPIGAVLDELDGELKAKRPGLESVPRVQSYFNAGVLLIDVQRWRKDRIAERAMDYLRRHPSSPFSDQDALNVACDGRWKPLNTRWNYQGHLRNKIEDLASDQVPGIVHFITANKPWKPRRQNLNSSFYDAFRKRTRFARTRCEIRWDAVQVSWSQVKGLLGRVLPLRGFLKGLVNAGNPMACRGRE
jgi:lipopolysaccharide biosynthesis glycosyltransferase